MGKTIRRVIAILLAVTAVLLMCLPSADAQALTQRGDFDMAGSTIAGYTGNASDLAIPNGVTVIGKDAFSGCESLVSVTIPDSVSKIDYEAFENCKNLKEVLIPESVKTIGSSAFSGCEKLENINIPSKVSEIGSAAFARCTSLNTISVSSANEYYTCIDGVLYTSDGRKLVQYLAGRTLSTYSMPLAVKEIEEYAFWGAQLLTDVTISSGVKEISEYAFANCSGLTSVTIPPSVTALQAYSFGDCINLQTIFMPDTVGYIDDLAFASSGNVEIRLSDAMPASEPEINNDTSETDYEAVTDSENPGVPSENNDSDQTNHEILDTSPSGYSAVDFSDNVLPGELGSGKIVGGSVVMLMSPDMPVRGFALDDAELEDSVASSSFDTTFSSAVFDMIGGVLANYNGVEESVKIPSGVNKIGNRLFYNDKTITNVELPESMTEIGDFSFARSGLDRIQIPNGVEKIGYAAFYYCESLNEAMIPNSVKTIELGAFDGSLWLNNWFATSDENNFLTVGDGILLAYKGEGGNISIPDGTKTIGAGCFSGNKSITGVFVPSSVTTIGEDAFNGCTSLSTIDLPEGLIQIEDRAFKNTGLNSVRIPSTVISVGLGAFGGAANQNSLKTVIFEGTKLPNVTYKPTASRLSAQDLRDLAFAGVENAIVKPDCDLNSGTIFDTGSYGFRGQIYRVTSDAVNGQGTLELQRSTKEPDVNSGIVSIDPHVTIDGSDYIMTGVKESAFDAYENCEEWSGKRLTNISIAGNASESLGVLLSGISFSAEPGVPEEIANLTEDNAIFVQLDKSGFQSADADKASARIPGNTKRYILQISEDESLRAKLNLAFYNYYGQVGDITMMPLNMSMTDHTGTISIEKLAVGKLEMILPIPARFIGIENLKVGAIDDNGTLEELSTERITVDGADCLRFVASHLSPYVIYKITSQQAGTIITENEEGLAVNQISGVVQTLNKRVNTIEVKWFIIVILLSTAAILFLWKDHFKQKNVKINNE